MSLAGLTFNSPLASSIFAPSIEQVMEEFNSTNEALASFIVSVYLLGYCFGPLVVAPLSEMYGRLPLYHICNVLFVIFTIACALAPSLDSLIAFRFLAGLAGCCPLTNGAGTLADMISREKRGVAMAAWVAGPLFGPVIGPIGGHPGNPIVKSIANAKDSSRRILDSGQRLAVVVLGGSNGRKLAALVFLPAYRLTLPAGRCHHTGFVLSLARVVCLHNP